MNAPFAEPMGARPSPASQMQPPLDRPREVKKAVILAAGRGRRMGKLTADRPKGALEVGGHALIDWQIEALRAAGVKEIAIVTGHGAEALRGRDVTYLHNPDWSRTTQVETLLAAREWIGDEPAFVSYSDILYHPCAPLALLERPGEIIIAYDADHRWLWKKRFGNWLRDSETFRLGPGQVLTEIGGKPTNIEELDGQFMGLMLLTPAGLTQLVRQFLSTDEHARKRLDFTKLISLLVNTGTRVDTAANQLSWIEIDSPKDLMIAGKMAAPDGHSGQAPQLKYEIRLPQYERCTSSADVASCTIRDAEYQSGSDPIVSNVLCIQNWGRSGSTFLQSLFDNHPQIVSTPNFYSRLFYQCWATKIALVNDERKIEVFLESVRQWWDPGFVDATGGLHRLGDNCNVTAGVSRDELERHLRACLDSRAAITRRSLFIAAHLAYARARGQSLSAANLRILYPIHGEPRSVAAAMLEDFPAAQFVHTLREPAANLVSACRYTVSSALDERVNPTLGALSILFGRYGERHGRMQTMFGDRPYFPWLSNHRQMIAVRLEDLNSKRRQAMEQLATWVGIEFQNALVESTFDGRVWWNRTDTNSAEHTTSGATRTARVRSASPLLPSIGVALASKSPLIRSAYGLSRARTFTNLLVLRAMLLPWPVHGEQVSTTQRLVAAAKFPLLWPPHVRARLRERICRYRFRNSLLEHGSATTMIRRRLPPDHLHRPVNACLIVVGGPSGWKTKALTITRTETPRAADHLDAFFLEEAVLPPSIREHLITAIILLVGDIVARAIIGFRLRAILFGFFGGSSQRGDSTFDIINQA